MNVLSNSSVDAITICNCQRTVVAFGHQSILSRGLSGGDRLRTDDLRLAKPALSLLSYTPVTPSAPWNRARSLVGLGGVEPPTSPLSGARSNQLSYRPHDRTGMPPWFASQTQEFASQTPQIYHANTSQKRKQGPRKSYRLWGQQTLLTSLQEKNSSPARALYLGWFSLERR